MAKMAKMMKTKLKKIEKLSTDDKGYRSHHRRSSSEAGCVMSEIDTKIHPALKEYFGYCLKKAAARHSFMMSEQLLSKVGLVPPQFGILLVLRSSEPLNQVSLGEELGIDKASMVKLIDGLEEKKLVERLPSLVDRRIKLVKITAKGLKFALKKVKAAAQVTEQFLSGLTPEERRVLREAIPKLIQT